MFTISSDQLTTVELKRKCNNLIKIFQTLQTHRLEYIALLLKNLIVMNMSALFSQKVVSD